MCAVIWNGVLLVIGILLGVFTLGLVAVVGLAICRRLGKLVGSDESLPLTLPPRS